MARVPGTLVVIVAVSVCRARASTAGVAALVAAFAGHARVLPLPATRAHALLGTVAERTVVAIVIGQAFDAIVALLVTDPIRAGIRSLYADTGFANHGSAEISGVAVVVAVTIGR